MLVYDNVRKVLLQSSIANTVSFRCTHLDSAKVVDCQSTRPCIFVLGKNKALALARIFLADQMQVFQLTQLTEHTNNIPFRE